MVMLHGRVILFFLSSMSVCFPTYYNLQEGDPFWQNPNSSCVRIWTLAPEKSKTFIVH